ncbi:hypothetical protein C6P45_004275 [Maudiozyma exigua]|uniref:Glucosidase 2 subunit beta n=1 Tax=Maudiozyma exigua TaxID=34358 RepID=A0A9P6WDJ3_MAUEX|nr:hypothetical protein C6P45_004275 [Kazachstania exigua]
MKASHTIIWTLSVFQLTKANIIGVSPKDNDLYKPDKDDKWACLNDSSIVIDFERINDGICDCPDGSDEPGTSACSDTLEQKLFYCENKGFKPRYIRGSLVGDGVCDCCDCSDEKELFESGKYNTCQDLAKSFKTISDTEMKEYNGGVKILRNLIKHYKISDGNAGGDVDNLKPELEKLEADIKENKGEIENLENLLKENKATFRSRLEIDDPLLLNFEEIDLTYLINEIQEIYANIETTSQAYQDLLKILKDLDLSYTESLNDRVVNDNMDKFNKLMRRPEMKKVIADPQTDIEQRDQLLEYFQDELPMVFWERESEFPADYVIKKSKFVMAMVDGKANYMETLRNYIKEFSELMTDISENYNVNFQDVGTLTAVDAYKNYLSKYTDLGSAPKYELPAKFIKEYNHLVDVIEEDVPQLLFEENDSDETLEEIGGNRKRSYLHKGANLQHDNGGSAFGVLRTDIESLKEQIETYKTMINELNKVLNENEIKHTYMTKLYEEHKNNESLSEREQSLNENDRLMLRQIIELLEKMEIEKSTITELLDNYRYDINLNPLIPGSIQQHEDKSNGNSVNIGNLKEIYLDHNINMDKFANHIKLEYGDDDIITHLFSDKNEVGERDYLFENLDQNNNGLIFEYDSGDKCWNGPRRSAKLYMKCSENFGIQNVYEMTKCTYMIDASGPLGCNLNIKG